MAKTKDKRSEFPAERHDAAGGKILREYHATRVVPLELIEIEVAEDGTFRPSLASHWLPNAWVLDPTTATLVREMREDAERIQARDVTGRHVNDLRIKSGAWNFHKVVRKAVVEGDAVVRIQDVGLEACSAENGILMVDCVGGDCVPEWLVGTKIEEEGPLAVASGDSLLIVRDTVRGPVFCRDRATLRVKTATRDAEARDQSFLQIDRAEQAVAALKSARVFVGKVEREATTLDHASLLADEVGGGVNASDDSCLLAREVTKHTRLEKNAVGDLVPVVVRGKVDAWGSALCAARSTRGAVAAHNHSLLAVRSAMTNATSLFRSVITANDIGGEITARGDSEVRLIQEENEQQ